jgi:hypothetical protein
LSRTKFRSSMRMNTVTEKWPAMHVCSGAIPAAGKRANAR